MGQGQQTIESCVARQVDQDVDALGADGLGLVLSAEARQAHEVVDVALHPLGHVVVARE